MSYQEQDGEAEIVVRPATRADAGSIATILREIGWFEALNQQTPAESTSSITERLKYVYESEEHTILIAEQRGGEIVGYIAVHWFVSLMRGQEGYVSELFVKPNMTGNGVGSKLLQAIQQQAVQRNCLRLMLINWLHRESYRRGFYAQKGWTEQSGAALFTVQPL